MEGYLIIGTIVLVALYIIYVYNQLIQNTNLVKEGWSGIEVYLKQRANLIPNLVSTVKGYAQHEDQVFEKVTKLRTECLNNDVPKERAIMENQLTQALRQLFAVAENYPDLKASQNFLELQKSLQEIENQIQTARRYYNATVRDLNILIESFPSNQVARHFKFSQAEFFELQDDVDRQVPKVDF